MTFKWKLPSRDMSRRSTAVQHKAEVQKRSRLLLRTVLASSFLVEGNLYRLNFIRLNFTTGTCLKWRETHFETSLPLARDAKSNFGDEANSACRGGLPSRAAAIASAAATIDAASASAISAPLTSEAAFGSGGVSVSAMLLEKASPRPPPRFTTTNEKPASASLTNAVDTSSSAFANTKPRSGASF